MLIPFCQVPNCISNGLEAQQSLTLQAITTRYDQLKLLPIKGQPVHTVPTTESLASCCCVCVTCTPAGLSEPTAAPPTLWPWQATPAWYN